MTDQLKDYEVTEARFIDGQHRAVGEPVKMSERAAKYYMQPHGAGLKVSAASDAEAQAPADAESASGKKRK